MNNDESLDLLDLEDDASMDDALPDAAPLTAPRPKKPWLLLGIGALVIILATYIIISVVGSDSSSSIEVDLDAPVVVTDGGVTPPVPVAPAPTVTPAAAPSAQPAPAPTRVIEDRRDVTFNPNAAPAPQPAPAVAPQPAQRVVNDLPAMKPAPAAKPVAKPVAKPATKPAPKAESKPAATQTFAWYVQFGSYGTRAAAEAAQNKIRNAHSGLFAGKNFVIQSAKLANGTTTYRLRVGFKTANDANGFCQNAKSDGLDCYVAK